MKQTFGIALLLLAVCVPAQQKPAVAAAGELEAVLTKMDKAAASFKNAQADLQQETFTMVDGGTDTQQGKVFFRRTGKGMDIAVEIQGQGPRRSGARKIVFKDGKARMYQPGIDQITEYESGKNKSDIEAFVSLGFGGPGHDLLKSYEVKFSQWETIDQVRTARLELVPKSQRMSGMFSRIVLWVDPERDVLLRQQMFEPSKDHRLAHYSNIRVNAKLPEGALDLPHAKTTVKAQ
ncbi:MAG TPA: outer membrane lipoprotein carrier protein LolA [Candidatus Saccharimonadales bacterium]|jgi:outer membrane lipoprotein-sorting protein|nr:outer membrane lipoprotein carrier protein LolA [Candidatus Saccharimonadales bacterium]